MGEEELEEFDMCLERHLAPRSGWRLFRSEERMKSQTSLQSAVAGHVCGLPRILHFDEISPRVRLTSIEIREAIHLGELAAGERHAVPACHVWITRERGDSAPNERRRLRDGEMRL